jgi:hypothetical protein
MAAAMKRAMATATMVVGNKEGNCDGGKSNGNSNEGGRQAIATRVMATRVVGEQCVQYLAMLLQHISEFDGTMLPICLYLFPHARD